MATRRTSPYVWLTILSLAVTLSVFAYSSGGFNSSSREPSQVQQNEIVLPVEEGQEAAEAIASQTEMATEAPSMAAKPESLQQKLLSCWSANADWQFYAPPIEAAPAHPTNYGQRFLQDADGNFVTNELLVVLHETVDSADSAINTFQVPHYQDSKQVSYHAIIRRNGTIINVVPIEMRAFGAGNSVFDGTNGTESVQTNPALPSSVNNFAFHISLESPPDSGKAATHSGYTDAQYQSLAWLIARTCTPETRVVTHKAVDRSGTRRDPRSFEQQKLFDLLAQYPYPRMANSQ